MIEDILTEMSAGGFVVTNTFQVTEAENVFGPAGWTVYLRNTRNTRTGMGESDTLEGALRAALRVALEGPTYERPQRNAAETSPKRREVWTPPPKAPILGDVSDISDVSEELF